MRKGRGESDYCHSLSELEWKIGEAADRLGQGKLTEQDMVSDESGYSELLRAGAQSAGEGGGHPDQGQPELMFQVD